MERVVWTLPTCWAWIVNAKVYAGSVGIQPATLSRPQQNDSCFPRQIYFSSSATQQQGLSSKNMITSSCCGFHVGLNYNIEMKFCKARSFLILIVPEQLLGSIYIGLKTYIHIWDVIVKVLHITTSHLIE